MKTNITERLNLLRSWLSQHKLDAYIFPTTDPHFGEYTPEHWECRKWISGFTGSAGTFVVTQTQAALWTDSRYFIQANKQLQDSGALLMKERVEGTPSIHEWLKETLGPGSTVGLNGWVNSINGTKELANDLQNSDIHIVTNLDPADDLWKDRPCIPQNEIVIQPLEYAGQETTDKIAIIREFIEKEHTESILFSALDEIAWILNLRGSDTHCNPVFVSYLFVTKSQIILFVDPKKQTKAVSEYLADNQIEIQPYNSIDSYLSQHAPHSVCLDSTETSFAIYSIFEGNSHIIFKPSPIPALKAIKNAQEIAGFHTAMLKDGVAMTRFLIWLEQNIGKNDITEITIADKLYELRAQQDKFVDISFDTIAGYAEHGAIVHYEATPETDAKLRPEGLILIDSGAQYQDGTTDITRTIALGPVTEDEKKDYTLVLKGHLQLGHCAFPKGTCGTQLDVLARLAMWKNGCNYGHGTGHGVGSFLCVHEGPHQIRMNHMPALLLPGMTVTNEPGLYKEGKYGIRTENTLLIVPYLETEFGEFYKFEDLTLCPIDKRPIDKSLLTSEEIQWLNEYHQMVYDKLSPMLTASEKAWLKEATCPI